MERRMRPDNLRKRNFRKSSAEHPADRCISVSMIRMILEGGKAGQAAMLWSATLTATRVIPCLLLAEGCSRSSEQTLVLEDC